MPESTLTLLYWVHGTPLLHIASIEASLEMNVDTLKSHIFKSQPDLQGGPIKANLYKIPDTHLLPADREYEHDLSVLSISDLGQPLCNRQRLKNIFASQPKEEHLHLVLDATIMTIDVYICGAGPRRSLSISISRLEKVNVLKDRVKEIRTDFADISTDRLAVYKLSSDGDDELEEILDRYGDGISLLGDQKLEAFFNDLPFSQEAARVVVKVLPKDTRPPEPLADMTLNCWVCGDPMSGIFPIKISSIKTVEALKEAIKNKNPASFHDVDPRALALYKVSLPYHDDDSLKGVLGAYTISGLGQPLQGPQKLSTVFLPPPPDNQLHLIIVTNGLPNLDGLTLAFQSWIRGVDPAQSFEVKTPMKATVNGLKSSVKAAYGRGFDNLSPDRLKLYKITFNDDNELRESVDNLESGHLLHGNQLVKEVFDDALFSQMPRVIIELLGEKRSVAAVPSVVHGQLTYIRAWDDAPKKSPSEQGVASNFKILQSTDRKIEWTRPPDGISTIPVMLLHTVFGEFVDECHTHEPTSEDNTFVLELSSQMSKFFENERIVASSIADSDYQTDRDVHMNGRRYMILEVKSEVGSKGAEPYCQAILYYFEGSKDKVMKASKKHMQFNFPCLIITLFGPHLSFSGTVWTDCPNYQILSMVLPLFWHPTDTVMRQSAARRIGAFTKACQRLKELYVNYNRTPENFKDLQPEFPHPRCYKILDRQDWVHFRYIHSLEASKLLFIMEMDAGQKLCVKFT
ncbi:hypothetical protein EDC04DRAFT_2969244 [Pisolithus marmoratus]|nr:hypothetical protein EDC04DRAFT_2969244 [Pisolithus marmoratus]